MLCSLISETGTHCSYQSWLLLTWTCFFKNIYIHTYIYCATGHTVETVKYGLSSYLNGVILFVMEYYGYKQTLWKLRVKWNSHCIMSKKMGIVAFRSSISGTSVISRMGPTISGMNLILCGPGNNSKETKPKF